MEKYIYKQGYKSKLSLKENEIAIKEIRHKFQSLLEKELHLLRVTAPLFVDSNSGINDGLNGKEVPVNFNIDDNKVNLEIVHSLAKWKRYNISKYGLKNHEGIYTDMNAIRKDEIRDNYHSIYVDQWDYEILIDKEERNESTLKYFVDKIYSCIYKLEIFTSNKFNIDGVLPKKIKFISSEALLKKYPKLNSDERVNEVIKKYKAVFIYQIGKKLSDGSIQDHRAPDYDDWNLNGDIFLYNPILDNALEVSSMGIRVDKDSLIFQCKESNKEDNLKYSYHQKIINEELPFTLGGGIGQSRICMFMLKKLHIGEVQSSYWDEEIRDFFKEKGVTLL